MNDNDRLISAWIQNLRAARRSHETIRLRVYYIERFAAGADLLTCTSADLQAYLGMADWKIETARSVRSSLRVFFQFLREAGYRDDDPTSTLPKIRQAPPFARPASERAYREALDQATARQHLMLRLAGEAGLRRSEVAGLRREDLYEDLLGYSLDIRGKGGKRRAVPVSNSLAREISRFAPAAGWVFPSPAGGPLTAGHVGKLVARCLPAGTPMHCLRHRFATVVYQATGDLLAVQTLLGHESPATTQRYVLLSSQRLRAVALKAA